jgi:hypothetical protein
MQIAENLSIKHIGLLAFWILLASTTLCRAQTHFFLPIEVVQGLVFKSGIDPYTFSAQLHPSLGFGKNGQTFKISLSGAEVYTNPDWSFMWGGRLVLHLAKLRKKPIGSGPSISYGLLQLVGTSLLEKAELRRLAGGFILDIWDGSLQISPRAGYDFQQEKSFAEMAIGVNLNSK